jgi:hypothetical protein
VTGWPDERVEARVLAAAAGQLPVPTPRVHAAGKHDGWGYLLMSRLPGVPLDTAWGQVPAAGRDRLARQLGEAIAALHRLPPPQIDGWQPGDWPAFVAGQRAQCVSEQQALGLPALWAGQIPGFLDGVALPARPPVLLHTEVMRQHLLVTEDREGTAPREPQPRTSARANSSISFLLRRQAGCGAQGALAPERRSPPLSAVREDAGWASTRTGSGLCNWWVF